MSRLYDGDGIDGPFEKALALGAPKAKREKVARYDTQADLNAIRKALDGHRKRHGCNDWYRASPMRFCTVETSLLDAWSTVYDSRRLSVLFDGIRACVVAVKRIEPTENTPRCCGVFMLWREKFREYVCLRCGNGSAGR